MELILDLLRRLPDYPRLRTALESAQAVGVSGAAQINRSHLIAALCRDTARPAVVVCQDEMAARRTQSELAAFLGAEAPILPTRDLMFYDASAISRGWEQQRLRCLYDLARRQNAPAPDDARGVFPAHDAEGAAVLRRDAPAARRAARAGLS